MVKFYIRNNDHKISYGGTDCKHKTEKRKKYGKKNENKKKYTVKLQ